MIDVRMSLNDDNWHIVAIGSLVANVVTFALVSLFSKTSAEELSAAAACTLNNVSRPQRRELQAMSPQAFATELAKPLGAISAQREVEQAYSQLLSIYRQAMRQGGLPDDDIGVALGAFIVANYQVASDSSIDDEVSKAAYRQIRQLLAAEPSLQKLDGAHRQALFEELAIMAMTMETIFEQGERAALERAQPAARQYLQAVLQRPYNALRFTADGMTLAER